MLETFLFYRPDEQYELHGKKSKSSAPKPEEEALSSVLAIRLWKPSSVVSTSSQVVADPPTASSEVASMQCYRDFGKLILIG